MPGGWVGSTRVMPKGWTGARGIRALVLQRDGHRCTILDDGHRCTERGTEVDHIDRPDDHTLSNLRAICAWHHGKRSSQQGNTARVRLTSQRPQETHPGLNP